MLLIARPLDTQWMLHHDSVIDRVMAERGFVRAGSAADMTKRYLQYDHDHFETESAFYNLGMIDTVAEALPGVYLELQICPHRSRWFPS